MSSRCLNQYLTWPEGESEDTVADGNTLDAVKGPESICTNLTSRIKMLLTRNGLENEIYRLRGKEMVGGGLHLFTG